MTALTSRQVDILRIVFASKRLNMRGIADKLGSPNRLSGDLIDLVQKRCLHMEREGKEHIYTITTPGVRSLAKHGADAIGASIDRLGDMDLPREILVKLLDKLKEHVRTTWCRDCGGNDTEWGGTLDGADIETCTECHGANLLYGTLAEYEAYVKEKGFKVPAFNLNERDEEEVKERARLVKSKRDEMLEKSTQYALLQDTWRVILKKKRRGRGPLVS